MKGMLARLGRCADCHHCEISSGLEHSKNHDVDRGVWECPLPMHGVRVTKEAGEFYPLRRFFHCEDAPCVTVCISAAMRLDENGGFVHNDAGRRVACRMFVMVCPYDCIRIHEGDKVALACDLCPDEEEPVRARDCPMGPCLEERAVLV